MGFIHRIPDSVRKTHVSFYGNICTLTHPYQNAPRAAATGYPAVFITSHTFSKSFARLSIRHWELRYVFYDISAPALSVSDSTKFFFVHVWLCWHRCALIQTEHTLIVFRIVSVGFWVFFCLERCFSYTKMPQYARESTRKLSFCIYIPSLWEPLKNTR